MKANMIATILQRTKSANVAFINLPLFIEEDSHQIREYNLVLECTSDPDQIQGVLIDIDLVRQLGRVVAAEEVSTVRIDADAEVADTDLEHSVADNVRDRCVHPGVHLSRVVRRHVIFVV